MSLRKFLYYLLKPDGRSGKVVNGVVTYTGQPSPLPQTPDGWQEVLIGWERSANTHGIVTSFTLPLKFVRDGAMILRDAVYKETIEANVQLLIQKLSLVITDTSFRWVYKYFYRGEIDLSKAEDTQNYFNVPVTEGGLKALIDANWETVYEFPMNHEKIIYLKHDGINLEGRSNYTALDELEISTTNYGQHQALPITLTSSEQRASGLAFFSQSLENIPGTTSWDDRLLLDNYLVKSADNNPDTINLTIKGKLRFVCTERTASSILFKIRFYRSNQLIGNQADYEIFSGDLIEGETTEVNVNITIPLQPGERLYLDGLPDIISGTSVAYEFLQNSDLVFTFNNRYRTTFIPCWKRYDLFIELIKKITGSSDNVSSDLLQQYNSLLLTCGDAIRNIEGATLKTSLSDFFKDCDATLMAGMMLNQSSVEIETRETYYQVIDEVNLGKVVDLSIVPAADIVCNTYKFGHAKQEIEDVNGKYDPNGNNQFTGPLTKVKNEYNSVSPYKAGPYEIELLRINFDGKITTDDNSDNDAFVISALPQSESFTMLLSFVSSGNYIVFTNDVYVTVGTKFRISGVVNNNGVYEVTGVDYLSTTQTVYTNITITTPEFTVNATVEILSGAVYLLNRPNYSTIEGVPNDTVYNLAELTPKTMLLKHKRWISSINYGLGTKKILFTSGKENKNTDLKTVLDGVMIQENKDESISSFGSPMFLPFYFVFKTEVPVNLAELIEENPNRSYKFTDEYGQEWKGFLRIAGIAPNEYSPQEFRLLAAPGQDLTKLIHG